MRINSSYPLQSSNRTSPKFSALYLQPPKKEPYLPFTLLQDGFEEAMQGHPELYKKAYPHVGITYYATDPTKKELENIEKATHAKTSLFEEKHTEYVKLQNQWPLLSPFEEGRMGILGRYLNGNVAAYQFALNERIRKFAQLIADTPIIRNIKDSKL